MNRREWSWSGCGLENRYANDVHVYEQNSDLLFVMAVPVHVNESTCYFFPSPRSALPRYGERVAEGRVRGGCEFQHYDFELVFLSLQPPLIRPLGTFSPLKGGEKGKEWGVKFFTNV
jgi:hypothetical protein